jgi:hypothetical protein
MGYFRPKTTVLVVNPEESDPGRQNTVTLRALTYHERQRVKVAGVKQTISGKLSEVQRSGDADMRVDYDMAAGTEMLLKLCVDEKKASTASMSLPSSTATPVTPFLASMGSNSR